MAEILGNCIICDEPVEKLHSGKLYCGTICVARDKQWSKLTAEEKQKKINIVRTDERKCEVCQKLLDKDAKIQQIYCSDVCGHRASELKKRIRAKEEHNKKEPIKKECKICKKIFEVDKNSQKIYCSSVCCLRATRWKNLSEEEIKKRLEKNYKIFYCKNCNNVITSKDIRQTIFCNRKCNNEYATKELERKRHICHNFLDECKRKQGKCANCYETNIRLFEFAHYDRKDKQIDVRHCLDLDKVKKEIKLGRYLCICCHRIETYNETSRPPEKAVINHKLYVNNKKIEIGKCALCNIEVTESTTLLFDFDHIDQTTKLSTIAQLMRYKLDTIKEEIAKCRLLCCKCHRLYSIDQQNENLKKKKIQQQNNLAKFDINSTIFGTNIILDINYPILDVKPIIFGIRFNIFDINATIFDNHSNILNINPNTFDINSTVLNINSNTFTTIFDNNDAVSDCDDGAITDYDNDVVSYCNNDVITDCDDDVVSDYDNDVVSDSDDNDAISECSSDAVSNCDNDAISDCCLNDECCL